MSKPHSRRLLVKATVAGLVAAATGKAGAALAVTPAQTEGPFYPRRQDLRADQDNDLVRIAGAVREAGGIILHLAGVVRDSEGRALAGAIVEIWQCDARGVYLHGGDQGPGRRVDAAFQGFGRSVCDEQGRYGFRTIRPVPYPGRTPHIHFKVKTASGRQLLTTQMYVADEARRNRRDGLYMSLDANERKRLTVALTPRDNGELAGRFDLVV